MRWLIVGSVGFLILVGVVWSQAPRIARVLRKDVELTRSELPGAALLFPTGEVMQQKLDYKDGGLEIKFRSQARAHITWRTGEPLTTEESEAMMVKPLRETLKVSLADSGAVQVAGNPGSRWVLRSEALDMIVSTWSCGKRSFNLTVGSPARSLGSLNDVSTVEQRIRGSFECTPLPAQEDKVIGVGVEFDLGPDFGMDAENPLTLVSLDGDGLVVSPYAGSESPNDPKFDSFMPKLMDGVAATSGVTGTSFKAKTVARGQTGARKVWYGVGAMDGERTRMLSTFVDCGDDKYIAMYMGSAAKPESHGLDLLMGARCAKSPKRPPPAAEVARKACARGDKRGCAAQD